MTCSTIHPTPPEFKDPAIVAFLDMTPLDSALGRALKRYAAIYRKLSAYYDLHKPLLRHQDHPCYLTALSAVRAMTNHLEPRYQARYEEVRTALADEVYERLGQETAHLVVGILDGEGTSDRTVLALLALAGKLKGSPPVGRPLVSRPR